MNTPRKQVQSAYLASPLGFSEAGREFYSKTLVPSLENLGLKIIDPWKQSDLEKEIDSVVQMPFGTEKQQKWRELNVKIGMNNAADISRADMIIAVLDGVDVDSGTASEIGYAAALGKYIEGYRGDFRLSADNIGSTVNLQVEHFITLKGGSIATSVQELIENIKARYAI